eukprot:s4366_g4.t1
MLLILILRFAAREMKSFQRCSCLKYYKSSEHQAFGCFWTNTVTKSVRRHGQFEENDDHSQDRGPLPLVPQPLPSQWRVVHLAGAVSDKMLMSLQLVSPAPFTLFVAILEKSKVIMKTYENTDCYIQMQSGKGPGSLGKGAFAEVFRVQHKRTQQNFAVKVSDHAYGHLSGSA